MTKLLSEAMSFAVPASVQTLLNPAETVRWAAQPPPSAFMARGVPNVAYGVTWSVLGAFWYRGAGGIGRFSAFEGWWRLTPLFSLPFILAGFSFFIYPIGLGARARRTWYIITTERVFIAETPRRGPVKLRVFRDREIEAHRVVARFGGACDLLFAPGSEANPQLPVRLEDGFFGLRDVEGAVAALAGLGLG